MNRYRFIESEHRLKEIKSPPKKLDPLSPDQWSMIVDMVKAEMISTQTGMAMMGLDDEGIRA